jgi:hypothetical protein
LEGPDYRPGRCKTTKQQIQTKKNEDQDDTRATENENTRKKREIPDFIISESHCTL